MSEKEFDKMRAKIAEISQELLDKGYAHILLLSDLNIHDIEGMKNSDNIMEKILLMIGCYGNSYIMAAMVMEFLSQNIDVYKHVRAMIMTELSHSLFQESMKEAIEKGEQIDLGFDPKVFPGGKDDGGNC
jgi:hypothetical protein